MKHLVFSAGLVLFASLVPVASLQAQAIQGAILGTVADASGGGIPNAKVEIRNEVTNFERTIQTGAQGDYRVSGLESGNYQVTIMPPGFTTFKQTHVDLSLKHAGEFESFEPFPQPASVIFPAPGERQIGKFGVLSTE
jgi:hypothetical protein